MAKLKDVIVGKGKYFMIQDVIGAELLITEDLTPESDVRMDEPKDGKESQYFCVQVKMGDDIKDLHLPGGAMKALGEALPKNIETWKGQVFIIDKVTGKGFNTKTFISYVRKEEGKNQELPLSPEDKATKYDKTIDEAKKKLDSMKPSSSGSPQDNALPAQSELIRKDMEAIKGAIDAGCTITDGIMLNILKDANGVSPAVAQENFNRYKEKGLIYNAGKGWRVA